MRFILDLSDNALAEMQEAFDWYESRREGLGDEFLEELDAFYDAITGNPLICSFLSGNVREGALKRFPYCVVYEVVGNSVAVFSVFNTSQDPAKKKMK